MPDAYECYGGTYYTIWPNLREICQFLKFSTTYTRIKQLAVHDLPQSNWLERKLTSSRKLTVVLCFKTETKLTIYKSTIPIYTSTIRCNILWKQKMFLDTKMAGREITNCTFQDINEGRSTSESLQLRKVFYIPARSSNNLDHRTKFEESFLPFTSKSFHPSAIVSNCNY